MLLSSIVTLVTCGVMIIRELCRGGVSSLPIITSWPIILILVFGGFFACFSWFNLLDAAIQRGEQVRSAVDLYRAALADALGLELPATEAEERRMWRLVSRRTLLRVSDDRLPDYKGSLDDFRKKAPLDKDTSTRQTSKRKAEANKEQEEEEGGEEEGGEEEGGEEEDEEEEVENDNTH
jgi:hypothetical protein